MQDIPSNVIPFLVGFPVFGFFGWRALVNYRRLHNPLSGYFAVSGFLASSAFFFWSVPLFFSQDLVFLQITSIIGDAALYAMLFAQAVIVHYLVLRDKISRRLMLTPILVLAIAGFLANSYGYLHNGVAVVDGSLEYSLPLFSSIAQIMLISNVFIVGVILLSRLNEQSSGRSKSSLMSIGILYILSGIAGALNVILSGKPNDSPVIIGSYLAGFGLFVVVLLGLRIRKSSSAGK